MMNLYKKDFNQLSDKNLVEVYKNTGNARILEELYCRYTHLILSVCYKYLRDEDDSKDAVMEIFENLIDSLKKNEVGNFKNWLYQVTKNHCLKRLQKYTRMKNILKNYSDFMENENFEDHVYEDKIEESDLEAALNELNDEQRICIKLFYLTKRSYKEIADLTGYEINQVKSYIQNGKRNLKNILS